MKEKDTIIEHMRSVLSRLLQSYRDLNSTASDGYDLDYDQTVIDAEQILKNDFVVTNQKKIEIALKLAKLAKKEAYKENHRRHDDFVVFIEEYKNV